MCLRMTDTHIALDVDSTLAATSEVAFDLIDRPDHTYADIESWDWGLEKFGAARYLSALWHAWTLRPHAIRPMEAFVATAVDRLHDIGTVDIVTNHPDHRGITEGKKEWLDDYGIDYERFVKVDRGVSKAEFDEYDVYIDDNPNLPAEVAEHNPDATMLLRDHPYNQNVEAPHIRVSSVGVAATYLSDDSEVELTAD